MQPPSRNGVPRDWRLARRVEIRHPKLRQRKIGEVAREVGLSEQRIREYERAGFISPSREPRTGDRLFGEHEVSQLHLLRHLIQERRFTLSGLQELIRRAPCWELMNCPWKTCCPAVQSPLVPCYELRIGGSPMPCEADCAQCMIRGSKNHAVSALLLPAWASPINDQSCATSADSTAQGA